MFTDEEIMQRCLRLARRGVGRVSPNPMVGCVIIRDGKIIGEGCHEKFGEPHAEVNAINSAPDTVEGADLYVNLEPCSLFGKTPPCTDLLIEKKIRKVFVAMLDPNPEVNGNGVKKLRDAGIEVEVGLLGEEAKRLNEAFTKYVTTGLPFVTLKIAQSLDGRIALPNGKSKYISSGESLKRVHSLRAEYDAVLVGAGTLAADNPLLTVRFADGRSPVRIVLDGRLRSPVNSRMFHDGEARVILFHATKDTRGSRKKLNVLKQSGVETHRLRGDREGNIKVSTLMKAVARLGIASVLVEGGGKVFSEFIKKGAADKLELFTAPVIFGEGKGFAEGIHLESLGRAIKLENVETTASGPDQQVVGYFKK